MDTEELRERIVGVNAPNNVTGQYKDIFISGGARAMGYFKRPDLIISVPVKINFNGYKIDINQSFHNYSISGIINYFKKHKNKESTILDIISAYKGLSIKEVEFDVFESARGDWGPRIHKEPSEADENCLPLAIKINNLNESYNSYAPSQWMICSDSIYCFISNIRGLYNDYDKYMRISNAVLRNLLKKYRIVKENKESMEDFSIFVLKSRTNNV